MLQQRAKEERQGQLEGAFTLVEVLLAILLFAVIALAAFQTLGSAFRFERMVQKNMRSIWRARWLMDDITRDLHNAIWVDPGGQMFPGNAFRGQKNKIEFLIPGDGEIISLAYYQRKKGAGPWAPLVREETFLTDDEGQGLVEKPQSTTLEDLPFPGGVRFRYATWPEKGGLRKVLWSEGWEEPYLPALVRVEILFPGVTGPGEEGRLVRIVHLPVAPTQGGP